MVRHASFVFRPRFFHVEINPLDVFRLVLKDDTQKAGTRGDRLGTHDEMAQEKLFQVPAERFVSVLVNDTGQHANVDEVM